MPEGDARLSSSHSDRAASVVAITKDVVRELRAELPRVQPVELDSDLERDLGLDSLGRAELLRRLEEAFGVQFPPHTLSAADTVGDLLRALPAAVSARPSPGISAAPIEALAPALAPEHACTLLEVLSHHAAAHPERTHLTLVLQTAAGEAEQKLTFGELAREADRVAAGLLAHGLERGDRVALMLPTSRDFFVAFFGVMCAGGVPVPIYPPARRSQLEEHVRRQAGILNNCSARFLISFREARAVAWLLRASVLSLRRTFCVADLVEMPEARRHVAKAGDIALLQYTSGSTGEPKGVILTHANVLANIRVMGRGIDVRPSDVFLSWLPLYHDMGLIGAWLSCLYYALPLVVMSPIDFLARPERWLHAITRYGATLSAGPNFAYEICATRVPEERLGGVDLRSWRVAFNGAEPVVPETIARFAQRYTPYGYDPAAHMPVYGLAESAVGLTFPPFGRGPLIDVIDRDAFARTGAAIRVAESDAAALRIVSCGRPLAGYQVRVVDHAGEERPERQEGRIEFHGPSATSGYFDNPEATRRLFRGAWLDTGDMGYIAEGELYLTGRVKDVIIRAGQHIHPQDAEAALGFISGIRKGCVTVFGVPDARSGTEKVVVLAETRETDQKRRAALHAAVAERMVALVGSPPDDVVLAPPHTVLKTSSGKLRRAACRDLYLRGMRGGNVMGRSRQRLRFLTTALDNAAKRAQTRIGTIAYGSYVWILAAMVACAAALLVLVLPQLQHRQQVIRSIARLFVRATGIAVRVVGREHLARPGPLIIVANHASYFDAILLTSVLPASCRFVAKQELRASAPMRLVLERLGTRFVERFDAEQSVEGARDLVAAVRAGESLVFFPEGTFTSEAGLRPFHAGAFLAAASASVPVIPIAIRGTRFVLRDGQWLPRRSAVTVVVMPPLAPHGSEWTDVVRLRDESRRAILAACGEPDLPTAAPIEPGHAKA